MLRAENIDKRNYWLFNSKIKIHRSDIEANISLRTGWAEAYSILQSITLCSKVELMSHIRCLSFIQFSAWGGQNHSDRENGNFEVDYFRWSQDISSSREIGKAYNRAKTSLTNEIQGSTCSKLEMPYPPYDEDIKNCTRDHCSFSKATAKGVKYL